MARLPAFAAAVFVAALLLGVLSPVPSHAFRSGAHRDQDVLQADKDFSYVEQQLDKMHEMLGVTQDNLADKQDGEGETEVQENKAKQEGETEVQENKAKQEGETEVQENKAKQEGETEVQENKAKQEGETEAQENKENDTADLGTPVAESVSASTGSLGDSLSKTEPEGDAPTEAPADTNTEAASAHESHRFQAPAQNQSKPQNQTQAGNQTQSKPAPAGGVQNPASATNSKGYEAYATLVKRMSENVASEKRALSSNRIAELLACKTSTDRVTKLLDDTKQVLKAANSTRAAAVEADNNAKEQLAVIEPELFRKNRQLLQLNEAINTGDLRRDLEGKVTVNKTKDAQVVLDAVAAVFEMLAQIDGRNGQNNTGNVTQAPAETNQTQAANNTQAPAQTNQTQAANGTQAPAQGQAPAQNNATQQAPAQGQAAAGQQAPAQGSQANNTQAAARFRQMMGSLRDEVRDPDVMRFVETTMKTFAGMQLTSTQVAAPTPEDLAAIRLLLNLLRNQILQYMASIKQRNDVSAATWNASRAELGAQAKLMQSAVDDLKASQTKAQNALKAALETIKAQDVVLTGPLAQQAVLLQKELDAWQGDCAQREKAYNTEVAERELQEKTLAELRALELAVEDDEMLSRIMDGVVLPPAEAVDSTGKRCCMVCKASIAQKACGHSCISMDETCTKSSGCACNADDMLKN